MPTARELLEEADALMRRNRSLQGDDIPLLTDSVPVLPEAQVLRGRGAQVRGGIPLAPAAPPDGDALDSIPTLTESVEEEVVDVPVALDTDGEPSDWLRDDAGEPSITGEVPDSVLVVPPPEEAEADDDSFFEDDGALSPPRTDVAESIDLGAVAEPEEIEVVAPLDDVAEAAFAAELGEHTTAAPTLQSLAHVPEFAADADDDDDAAPTLIDTAIDQDDAPEEFVAPPEPVALLPLAPPDTALAAPPPEPVQAAPVPDDTKWEGVAEEIRMQVLQRIDIFTDTGLREQLALRLQPIVDRASADLVATINQHVGELLRAYVAEAIEREIESWRRSH